MSEKGLNRQWSSRYVFIMASIGSTVGLSNIWKFTYLVGENGGGAFVLIYLASLILLGIPVLTSEFMLGKLGGKSMVGSLALLSENEGISRRWQSFGWISNITVFMILSFYCVIAGLTIDYTVSTLSGNLTANSASEAVNYYEGIMTNPLRLIVSTGIFVLLTTIIVARGVGAGLEKTTKWMMPGLFIILFGLLMYAAFTGEFVKALKFMFVADFSKITASVALTAFGQAFFSLGIGLGVMLTYGAYMPKEASITRSSVTIALADGLVAIIAGLAIFPIVFQYKLSPAEGPGLIFMTLPIAFGQMPGGNYVGALFFILLAFAALSSSISLLESVISRLEELYPNMRARITWIAGTLLWLMGWLTVFSFNIWSDFTPIAGKTVFGLIDYLASNLIMPVGGILMAVIGGWFISKNTSQESLKLSPPWLFVAWRFLVRYVGPIAVLLIFLSNL
ncbi:MAG: sodium-dependent transporter [Bacteroidota bacterium]